MHSNISVAKVPSLKVVVDGIGAKDSTRFWLNHPIRWVQVIGIIVALVQKENADTVLRIAFIPSSDLVDDSSGATIELVISKEEHRRKMPDVEYDERQERLWKRRRKPGHMDVGTLIKVKGEIQEKWNIRKINVMKLGIYRMDVFDDRYCDGSECGN